MLAGNYRSANFEPIATDDDPLQAAAALARWVGDQEDELRTLEEAFTQVRESLPKDLDEI
jgi:hypothetical protein